MSEITYDDKVDLQVATNIANINKVTASDMNEIKNVVNGNADDVGDLTNLTTTDKTSIVNAVNELNAPEKWVSVGATAPTDGERVWFAKGKNLYNENAVSLGTISQTDGKTITSNASVRYTPYYIKITPNTSYTLSYSGTISLTIRAFYYNANYNYLSTSVIGSSTTSQTFTTPQNAYYIRLQFGADYYAKSMQLEEGTTATTYEPYIEQNINVDNSTLIGQDNLVSVGINQPGNGKRVWFKKSINLLDVSISSQTINGVTLTANNDGSVTCNGTASATIVVNLLSSNLTLPAGTYTLSGCPSGGSLSSNYKLDIYKSGESSYLAYDSGNSASFTLTETTTFDKVRLVIFSGYSATNLIFYPMLEEGSTASTYEPYVKPSINVDGEEWYSKSGWVNKTAELIIDNSNIQTTRTFLLVNEALRLVYLQVFYNANVSSTTIQHPIKYPIEYKPALLESDRVWFTMSPSNGGSNTARGSIQYNTTETYINILAAQNNVSSPFGSIMYPY